MKRELKGKVIVITGASAGIGACTAVEAGKAGMRVVLAARREERLAEVAEKVQATGAEVLQVPTDVGEKPLCWALVEKTVERFGRVDVMFANAGFGFLNPIISNNEAEHRRLFEVNYWGTIWCVQAAAEVMRKQGGGHILITSSVVGKIGLPYYAAYSASKAAQDAVATAIRLELEPDHIDVTSVYPVGTRTEFFQVSAKTGGFDSVGDNTPAMFMQTPEHVARRIMGSLRKPVAEVWPSRLTHLGVALGVLLPGLTKRGLRKQAEGARRAMAKGEARPQEVREEV